MGAAAGGVLALELCAPLLLLCWLCCWPDDKDDSSSSGHPRKPVIAGDGRRRSQLRTRLAGSAVSLHLPGPSGSPCMPAHRSHEDLSSARHHSAPSVIHEVLHRRDWDRSSRDLYLPLRPPSPARCKKHHANIKRSRQPGDGNPAGFYIGDDGNVEDKSVCPEKEEKQCMNESIRSKQQQLQRWRLAGAAPAPPALRPLLDLLPPLEALDRLQDEPDRSGAVHHALDSRAAALGYARIATMSPISVDVVGYSYGAGAADGAVSGASRARHGSDGDILAPAPRPESGAFSESDLDLEIRLALADDTPGGRGGGERGGGGRARGDRRETAI